MRGSSYPPTTAGIASRRSERMSATTISRAGWPDSSTSSIARLHGFDSSHSGTVHPVSKLSHVDETGAVQMVDVGGKALGTDDDRVADRLRELDLATERVRASVDAAADRIADFLGGLLEMLEHRILLPSFVTATCRLRPGRLGSAPGIDAIGYVRSGGRHIA